MAVQSLTFIQLLILIGIGVALISPIVVFLFKRGFSIKRKDMTFTIGDDGEKIPISRTDVFSIVLLLEALKIKDDLHDIDHIILKRQKKHLKENIPVAQELQMNSFKRLLLKLNPDLDENKLPDNHDYLYFSLLTEKVYNSVFSTIMDDFDHNGLAKKENPVAYAKGRAEVLVRENFILYHSLYSGIISVPKTEFDTTLENDCIKIKEILSSAYLFAIDVAGKGYVKKEELRTQIFEKIGKIDGISKDQLKNLFSDITTEDFLAI